MKLAAKIAASLAGLALLAMAGEALVDQRRRADLLEMDTLKDWRMGRVLQANVETLWRVGGEQNARLVVETTDRALPTRMIHFVPLAEITPVDLRDELPWTRLREDVAWRHLPDGTGSEMRYLYIPLAPNGTVQAAIVVGESLAPLDAHMRARLKGKAAAGLTMVGLSGLLSVLLGTMLVDRPISALREAVRALDGGQEPPPIPHARRRDELGQLAQELQAVGQRLATRERLRHADRLRTIGQLAAGIGHELGAPLSVVGLRAGMIASGESTGEEARQNARIIGGQIQRMTGLVRQLLDYSRRQAAQASVVDVRQVMGTTIDMLEPLAGKHSVRLDWSQPADAVLVRADPIQLQQVFTNLAMNGVQAMSAGGTLRVEVGRGEGGPAGQTAGRRDQVWIRISDEGTGIDPEHLPHVFEPFYTTKAVGEGTGLGLAVVQAIVEEHGGWIDVTSELGSGSQFTVWLAAAPAVEERLAS